MPLFFLGTREWRNRQTRTVQVRVPVMEWGFNSPLAHDETADPFGICGFCFPWLLLVAPLVFRAPSGPAAREIATREPKGSEWSISKPARALRSLRHPPYRRRLRCWCVAWCVVSMPGQTLSPPTGTAARPRLHAAGLVSSACVHRCCVHTQFRMQFPHDSLNIEFRSLEFCGLWGHVAEG